MAFIDTDSEKPDTNPTFYNVSTSVGQGGRNTIEDVKVVQFFLNRVYQTKEFKDSKPQGAMTIDGKVGPITGNWIRKFQMDMRTKRGKNVLIDGIIDKAGNETNADNFSTSISHTEYSIRYLNNILRKLDTPVYKTLSSNPVVPPDVRMIFSQINAAGPAMNFGADV